jgi:hypothetical protein
VKLCAICPYAILPWEDAVEISAEPYNLTPGGEAHKDCADDATIHAIAAQQDAADAYYNR